MFIKKLSLKNFRNYKELSLDFTKKKTLIIGKNAQGKTNILESILYLSCLKSNRAKNDKELILWEENSAKINAEITKDNIDIELEVTINPPKKKEMKLNGIKKNKMSDFAGQIAVINFGVSDLLLLRGNPEDRRNWLDTAISQIYPTYLDRLAKYNKIKLQKNNFLKSLKGNLQANLDLLDVFNTQLITAGSNIIYLRLKYLKELQKIAKIKHSEIAEKEILKIVYKSNLFEEFDTQDDELISVENIAENYKKIVEEKKAEEIIRAQTLAGPHRDDISFFINQKDANKYASQGQQRTIVLALKLAELDFIKEKISYSPILLLDDVLAELDDIRQNFLLKAIDNLTQTIITSVDTLQFAPEYLKDVEIFKIENGALKLN